MKIIFLYDYKKIGKQGDIKNVSSGFARNFLIPYEKAIIANKKNINKYKEYLILKQNLNLKLIEESLIKKKKISELKHIDMYVITNKSGKLFGSINVKDIINILKQKSIIINSKEISIPVRKINKIGTYNIYFYFYDNLTSNLQLNLIRKL